MYDDLRIRELTKNDFDKAYQKAFFSRIISRFKGETNTLLSFDEVMKHIKIKNEVYQGLQCVNINEIVGSEGRYHDFNREFLPKRRNLRKRWERVDEAHYHNIILPPIRLYKLGQIYFVRDGNHRVSVAREQKREFIDAEVVEIKTDIKITAQMTREDLTNIIIQHEKENFLEVTNLKDYKEAQSITFSYAGLFDELLIHIHTHQYFIGLENETPTDFDTAVKSWYDNLYEPIVLAIRKERAISHFIGRTESDLYVWIIRYWDDLKRKYGDTVLIDDAVKSYSKEYGDNFWKKKLTIIKNFLFRGNK